MLDVKELINNCQYFDDSSINVKVIIEVNGNSILKEFRYFVSERHFFISYVYDRLLENFDLLCFDLGSKHLILKKDDVILRCFW